MVHEGDVSSESKQCCRTGVYRVWKTLESSTWWGGPWAMLWAMNCQFSALVQPVTFVSMHTYPDRICIFVHLEEMPFDQGLE